jgi:capsular polysaccharide transport system permease protein
MTSVAVFAEEARRGLWQQANVIFALIFKEFRSRTSSSPGQMGMFWTVCTPGLMAFGIASIWYFLDRRSFYGISPYLIMGVSVIPYALIRQSMGAIGGAMAKNMDLYGYPQVKPIDSLLARFCLDTSLTLIGASAYLFCLYWFADMVPSFYDPLATIGLYLLLFVLMIGVGLVVGVYSIMSDTFKRVKTFAMRPLILLSLVIHTGSQLPPAAQYWVSWNPLACITELSRYYMLGLPPIPYVTATYPAMWAIFLLAFGLIVYQVNRNRILRYE